METLKRVEELARRSQGAAVPQVDVQARVRATLRGMAPEPAALFDTPTLAFAGLSLAIMAMMFSLSLPAISALRDPWAAYMNTPWSF
ncbi:MAG: hypothetical protein JNK74_03550 [Candidatus Hydrogenedentes bacterium]|nr:hypothetical protein [Candidatus Hydrogenedentota bacterium]